MKIKPFTRSRLPSPQKTPGIRAFHLKTILTKCQ